MNKELIQQLIILKNLLLQSIPKDEIWVLVLGVIIFPLCLFSMSTYIVGRLAFRDALKKNKKMSDEQKQAFADNYLVPYSFFWGYYPARFLIHITKKFVRIIKRRKRHD